MYESGGALRQLIRVVGGLIIFERRTGGRVLDFVIHGILLKDFAMINRASLLFLAAKSTQFADHSMIEVSGP